MSWSGKWRPNGWDATKIAEAKKITPVLFTHRLLVEAGADAMLTALRDRAGVFIRDGEEAILNVDGVSGKIVFIPDDKVKEVKK